MTKNNKLTYCPKDILLDKTEIDSLSKYGGAINKNNAVNNWVIVVRSLLRQQHMVSTEDRITCINSKERIARLNVLSDGVQHNVRPIIVMDKDRIYEKLINALIMNNKKKPSAKTNISSMSDYNIISYFNVVARGLLSYYRCADDFYKMRSIVNWFLRYSAVSTIKFKHKLASRKTVFDTYGIDLNMINHEGKTIQFISTKEVMEIKQDFLINPEVN